jgi:hypothetical protein
MLFIRAAALTAAMGVFVFSSFGAVPLGKMLATAYPQIQPGDRNVVIVYLKDKGNEDKWRSTPAESFVSPRSLHRRLKVRSLENVIDAGDYPLNQDYVRAIARLTTSVRHQLKWFNAVSVLATKDQIESLRSLDFVTQVELVGRWKRAPEPIHAASSAPAPVRRTLTASGIDYGVSYSQLEQINVPALHDQGYFGQGIIVGLFDDGVRLLTHNAFDSMTIIAMHDFVDHKESVVPYDPDAGFHGTNTLSAAGGFAPGNLIGPAFKAHFILARTENDSSETPIEEDNWAAAIQWADSLGIDVSSTSLGYLTFDAPYTSLTWQNMDGRTAIISIAAAHAAALGITVINAAGNSGNDTVNTLVAPADADSIITAGAVDLTGARASFSSVGPTVDGRIKPDVMADGVDDYLANANGANLYGYGSGTSFATPLTAGAAALVLCAHPNYTPLMVREAFRETASQSAAPDNLMGWGIVDALGALMYYDSVNAGWNLHSLPKTENSYNIDSVYPGASLPHGNPFAYHDGYVSGNSVAHGTGFWIKFSAAGNIPVKGKLLLLDTVAVSAGWNMVGSIGIPLPVDSIVQAPDSIITSQFFGYTQAGYFAADTLFPNKGYWVKTKQSGQLVLKKTP